MRVALLGASLLVAATVHAADPVTVVEATGYGRDLAVAEVVDLVHAVAGTRAWSRSRP